MEAQTTPLNSIPTEYKSEWYQVINSKIIEGPFNVNEIVARVIREEFNGNLWIRKCKQKANWYKLDLNQLHKFHGTISSQDDFYSECAKLNESLENIKLLNIHHHDKYPGDEDKNKAKIDGWAFINWFLFIFMAFHMNLSIIFIATYNLYCVQSKKYLVFSCIINCKCHLNIDYYLLFWIDMDRYLQ